MIFIGLDPSRRFDWIYTVGKIIADELKDLKEPLSNLKILYLSHFSLWNIESEELVRTKLKRCIKLLRELECLDLELGQTHGTNNLLSLSMRKRLSPTFRLARLKMLIDAGFPNELLLEKEVFKTMFFDVDFEILRYILSEKPRADIFFNKHVGLESTADKITVENIYANFMTSKLAGSGFLLKACGTISCENLSWTINLLQGYEYILEVEMTHIYPKNQTILTALLKNGIALSTGELF